MFNGSITVSTGLSHYLKHSYTLYQIKLIVSISVSCLFVLCIYVHFRIEFKILLLTYKAQNNKAPGYISELIEEYKPQRSLPSAKKSLLVQRTFNNKTYGGRAFTICAPKLWNDLPQDIRQSTSLEIFKKRLKHHMFMRAFCVNWTPSSAFEQFDFLEFGAI